MDRRPKTIDRDRERVRGTAARLLPPLLLARAPLTQPLHRGVREDLHSGLTYTLMAGEKRADLRACSGVAARIVGLFVNDGHRVRERARSIASSDGRPGADTVIATTVLSNLEWTAGDLDEGLRLGWQAVARPSPPLPLTWRPYPYLSLAAKLTDLGETGEAESLIGTAYEAMDRRAPHSAAADAAIARGQLLLAVGKITEARAEVQAGVSLAARLGADWVTPHGLFLLAMTELRRDDVTSASDLMRRCQVELSADQVSFPSVRYRWGEYLVTAAQLTPERSAEFLNREYADLLAGPALFVEQAAAAPRLTRLALAAGDTLLATAVVTAAERLATANPRHHAVAVAAVHARALLRGDLESLRYAAREHHDAWAAALADEDVEAALAAAGTGREAPPAGPSHPPVFRHGREKGERAEPKRPRATRLAVPAAAGGRVLLTETEQRVMRLVAAGMTNQQAARSLSRSPHTVNYHLRRIFQKLNVRSRVELTRYFYERNADGGRRDPGEA